MSRLMGASPCRHPGYIGRDVTVSFANSQGARVLGTTPAAICRRSFDSAEWKTTAYDSQPLSRDQMPLLQAQSRRKTICGVQVVVQLTRLLEGAFQIRTAQDGETALILRMASAFHLAGPSGARITGMEVETQIRVLAGVREVKIAALIASVFDGQRDAVLAAGIDELLFSMAWKGFWACGTSDPLRQRIPLPTGGELVRHTNAFELPPSKRAVRPGGVA